MEGKLEEGVSSNVKVLHDRVKTLELMLGRQFIDKELLKKALQYAMQREKDSSSPVTAKDLQESKGGAK